MKKNKTVYGIEKILQILPHRQPFVLIDRIVELSAAVGPSRVGRKVRAIKNVTYNEPFFAGHFPHRAVMPGVLIIESMAQAAAVACCDDESDSHNVDIAIGRISEMRFRRPVVPGDQLLICGEVIKDRGQMVVIRLQSFVEDESVTEFDLLASVTHHKK